MVLELYGIHACVNMVQSGANYGNMNINTNQHSPETTMRDCAEVAQVPLHRGQPRK